jgi:hypothetical protein
MGVCKYRAFIFLDQPPPWVSRTETVGQQCIWGQDPVNQSNKLNHQIYRTIRRPKWQNGPLISWSLSLLPPRKTGGGETVNPEYIKKALAKSLAIFKLTWPGLLFQDWFLYLDNSPNLYCQLCPRAPGSERHQDNTPPILFTRYCPKRTFFSFQGLSQSWLASQCPRTASRLAGCGHADHHPRCVRHCLSAVEWALWQVHSDQQWLPWEKL